MNFKNSIYALLWHIHSLRKKSGPHQEKNGSARIEKNISKNQKFVPTQNFRWNSERVAPFSSVIEISIEKLVSYLNRVKKRSDLEKTHHPI